MAGVQSTIGERTRTRRGRFQPMSEINVTPFVDVMLVLLVVFMVTAPLLAVGVPVDLPQSDAQPLSEEQEPLTVSVTADRQIFLQETAIELSALAERLVAISQNRKDTRIYVRGDKDVDYGAVIELMNIVNGAGFNRVALVTEKID